MFPDSRMLKWTHYHLPGRFDWADLPCR